MNRTRCAGLQGDGNIASPGFDRVTMVLKLPSIRPEHDAKLLPPIQQDDSNRLSCTNRGPKMTTELSTTSPADQFRGKAAGLMVEVANMSLHELVDQFQSLSAFISDNSTPRSGGYGYDVNDAGKVAIRERQLVNAAARARFGISFDTYDRADVSSDDF